MINREPFDPARAFSANTFVRVSARTYRKGEVIDPAGQTERVMRRLYEQHKVSYAPAGAEVKPALSPAERLELANAEVRREQRIEAGQPLAMPAEPTEEEQPLIDKLVRDNQKPALLELAAGLEGVEESQTKPQIAFALVRAGRGTA